MANLPPPILVSDPGSLALLVRELAAAPLVAVDTESNSLFAYRERVCLIQFSTATHDYIVDPLKLADLSPLAPLLANPHQQKIFHAAEYDILCLKRDYGFEFNEIFDTMIAARALGWPHLGLAAILEARWGVHMNKKHQRANWGRRPLSLEQLDYARLDTHYLCALRAVLAAELEAAGRVEEAGEEFERLSRVQWEAPAAKVPAFWQVAGARDLTPAQAAILREVYLYREQQAQHADMPAFKIMSEETLVAIARRRWRDEAELRTVLSPTQFHRYAHGLWEAAQRGRTQPPLTPPPLAREPEAVRERYERLRRWRKQRALARGVESDVILPREALNELAHRAPDTPAALAHITGLGPWRRQAYGEEILNVLADKLPAAASPSPGEARKANRE